MQEELLEAFRAPLFLVYISVLLSFCVVSGSQLGDRVEIEFQAFRLQQYELAGNVIGSKSFRVMYEAVSLDSNSLRKATVASWRDLVGRDLTPLFKTAVGALIIVLPNDFGALTPADLTSFSELEAQLSGVTTELAVFAVKWSDSASALMSELGPSFSEKTTAVQQLFHMLSANTFQMSGTLSNAPTPSQFVPRNVIARLSSGVHSSPTIAFVAHYDTHAAFPALAVGTDSNGSGIVALLELLALLKKFYERPSTRPPYNMVFAWTAAGKYNYQGTKAFVDDFQEKNIDDRLELVVCLDSIGKTGLNVHVSKMPANGSAVDRFVKQLRFAAPNESIDVVAKKININLPFSWEHERLNARRLPALTLSHWKTAESMGRRSLLDTSIDTDALSANIAAIAETVLSIALALPPRTVVDERVHAEARLLSPNAVNKERLSFFVRQFASSPRPLTDPEMTEKTATRLAALASVYAPVRQSKVPLESPITPIAPERIVAEKVKPAVFEFFVAGGVAIYLAVVMRLALSAQGIIDTSLVYVRKTVS